jgi:hypothetical protein
MKTNDKDIEKMAEKFAEMLDEDGTPLVDAGLFQGYKAGFKACEAKMLAEASEGFEAYEKEYWDREAIGGKTAREWTQQGFVEMATSYQRKAFTAGAMSQAKRVRENEKVRRCHSCGEVAMRNDGAAILDENWKLKADREVLVNLAKLIAGNQEFYDEISDKSKTEAARQALKSIGEIE